MVIRDLRQSLIVLGSFVLGLFLLMLPLPGVLGWFRPSWPALILIYWLWMLPRSIGFWVAWLLGFWVDMIQGTLLGQHSLLFLCMALCLNLHRPKVRYLSTQQTWWWVLCFVSLMEAMACVLEGSMLGDWSRWSYHLAVSVSSAVVWPVVYQMLEHSHGLAWKPIR